MQESSWLRTKRDSSVSSFASWGLVVSSYTPSPELIKASLLGLFLLPACAVLKQLDQSTGDMSPRAWPDEKHGQVRIVIVALVAVVMELKRAFLRLLPWKMDKFEWSTGSGESHRRGQCRIHLLGWWPIRGDYSISMYHSDV